MESLHCTAPRLKRESPEDSTCEDVFRQKQLLSDSGGDELRDETDSRGLGWFRAAGLRVRIIVCSHLGIMVGLRFRTHSSLLALVLALGVAESETRPCCELFEYPAILILP